MAKVKETNPVGKPLSAEVRALSFEEAMRELDSIVAQMEEGRLSLEQSLAAYQRGAELVRHAQATLEAVRQQVQVLDGDLLKPLDNLTDPASPARG